MKPAVRRAGLVLLGVLSSCSRAAEKSEADKGEAGNATPVPVASAAPSASYASGPPALLYLPDGGDTAQTGAANGLLPGPVVLASPNCPREMVDVRGRFCIDRYEASLVDARSGRALSPYYHPTRAQTEAAFSEWSARARGRSFGVPEPPSFQQSEEFEPRAESVAGVTPNGYLSGTLAELACRNAGKRLCTLEEWIFACRGEAARKFPYGEHYDSARCNVFRSTHPAQVLHGDSSTGHLDPRLNLVEDADGPLLRKTGETPSCRSTWGNDAIEDMVGNLDEWVDAPEGAFLGGFYARSTREGCDAKVSSHPRSYFDYSLGTRCCR